MWWFPVSPRRFCPSVGGVTLIFLLLAVCLATGGIHVPVKIQDKDADATLKGIQAPIPLPTNFEERLSTEMRMTTAEKSRRMGDPAPIYRDKDSHTRGEDQARALGRQARGFFSFWPFSIEITKGKGADHHPGGGGGWGPSHYGSSPLPPFNHPNPHQLTHRAGVTLHASSHPIKKAARFETPAEHEADDELDPDNDPEVQKLRLQIYKMKVRAKKWKKIWKYNLAEVKSILVSRLIDFVEFI
ncbi:uncharacterized protein LOC110856877 isoform X2 [Folsomia candida]|uniref:uncharacterized protein LOC110856877 isoform X2 n=1 Tax=Folsomia candida TaxID=158441 RepID=UPI0016051A46|nr:uncharacterized protein LOC110856877 isoform X2 [Folsomia candida]